MHTTVRLFSIFAAPLCAFVLATLFLVSPTLAQTTSPVAIVEDASDDAPVETFDYLTEGERFVLPDGATATIGYMRSCRRETIVGGTITIGTLESTVEGGSLEVEVVDCDGGQVDLSNEEAAASGVVVFRGPEEPDVTLYSTTPAFKILDPSSASQLEIARVDRPGAVLRYSVESEILDLLKLNELLAPGGLYEARFGDDIRLFNIVVYAGLGGPIVGRLVRF